MTGSQAALQHYLGHTITAMSCLAGSTQLTLHLQSPAAAAAAQDAADHAAAAVEAAATWQVHQVRHDPRKLHAVTSVAIVPWSLSGHVGTAPESCSARKCSRGNACFTHALSQVNSHPLI